MSKIYEISVQQALDLSEPSAPGRFGIADRSTSAAGRCWGFSRTTVTISPSSGTENLPLKRFVLDRGGRRNLGAYEWPVGIETTLIVTAEHHIWCQDTVNLADFACQPKQQFAFDRGLRTRRRRGTGIANTLLSMPERISGFAAGWSRSAGERSSSGIICKRPSRA